MTRIPPPGAGPIGQSFDASANQATRDRRQELGHQAVMALHSILRNARVYAEDNAVFAQPVDQMHEAMLALMKTDGNFELKIADDGLYVNRQGVRFEAMNTPLVTYLKAELSNRGVKGIAAAAAPAKNELRRLVGLFTPGATSRPGIKGDPRQPLSALELLVDSTLAEAEQETTIDARLIDVYSHAVFFVARYIEQLRAGGEVIPVWAASRVVQDLVDLQREVPLRFSQLARTKAGADAYWGYHAANVAVLAITFGARMGLTKRRRHDLGMAALFHDVGMAALPSALLHKTDALAQKERAAVDASPLFAARAILRDREVHPAALDRAQAAYECHLDLAPAEGEPPEVGFLARVIAICESFDALTTSRPFRGAHRPAEALQLMAGEMAHRFDARLLELLPSVVEPLVE